MPRPITFTKTKLLSFRIQPDIATGELLLTLEYGLTTADAGEMITRTIQERVEDLPAQERQPLQTVIQRMMGRKDQDEGI